MNYTKEQLLKFKEFFDELYGEGLEIANWHHNGDLEEFDNFYDSAIESMNQERKEIRCSACNGSGWYDNCDKHGNPIPCGACNRTGLK